MDFIKDSAVKTVNGIKTEFAKTAKRERQNGAMQQISMPKRNPTKTDSKRKRQNRAKTELSQNRFKTDSKRSQQSIEKISKNQYYPSKFLEFRVESPKGNEIKEIQNFKETTFFDMSSAQPADFRKSDKVSKKHKKIDITP